MVVTRNGATHRLVRAVVRAVRRSSSLRRLGRVLPRALRRGVSERLERAEDADRQARRIAERLYDRIVAVDRAQTEAWSALCSRQDWEAFRDERLEALRRSLGSFRPAADSPAPSVTGTLEGDGFVIENLIYESRPGWCVTANLYRPASGGRPGPGILICHSHHHPKSQIELQEMGMTWARSGCHVLVPDQPGHGERRQHPFRPGRQDYFFRFNAGMQLDLIGESLAGWMVGDLLRGVDLLLDRSGVDPQRIVLIGSVAGGGDGAAVCAALDRRIAAAVPFGFGPARVARGGTSLSGAGSWESTRNLRFSARDGFAPWVILGAIAARRLIYAHEFAWNPDRDPVWDRLSRIYRWHAAGERLAAIHGSGSVRGQTPRDTHCNNVGPVHRAQIDPLFREWLGISPPHGARLNARTSRELRCTPAGSAAPGRPLHRLAADLADERLAASREVRLEIPAARRRAALCAALATRLGRIDPTLDGGVEAQATGRIDGAEAQRLRFSREPGTTIEALLLLPPSRRAADGPLVIGVTQEGPDRLARRRRELIRGLLEGGAAVCLPRLRGTGDPGGGESLRGPRSAATTASSSALMLGTTLVGERLGDLRTVLHQLARRPGIDPRRIALWGDSLASPNPPDRNLEVPFEAEDFPVRSEPLGGMIALLGALFDERIGTVFVRGGLLAFRSVLDGSFCYLPHDVVVPGLLEVADLPDLAAALAPVAFRLEAPVDGCNRAVAIEAMEIAYGPARAAYRSAGAESRLSLHAERLAEKQGARWILNSLEL